MTHDPNLTPTAPATQVEETKTGLDLSVPKVAGGALAAVTTAFAASFFGVNGTITGAAFGSVVSSVAAALYAASLQTAHSKIKTTRSVVLRTSTDGGASAAPIDPNDPTTVPPGWAHRTLPLPGHADVSPAGPQATPGPAPLPTALPAGLPAPRKAAPPSRFRLSWKPIAVLAGIAFAAAMVVIGFTELAIGHPLGNSKDTGTSIGSVVRGEPAPKSERATPSPSASPSETGSVQTTTESPSESASPSDSPSTSPDASGPATESPAASAEGEQSPASAQPTEGVAPGGAATP